MIYNWIGKDELNKKRLRGFETSNRRDYNCGGYALETFNWYVPFKEEEKNELHLFSYRACLSVEEILKVTLKSMIKEFRGNLRVIEKVEDLKEGEYAIAYRVGERDFHFAKRNSKGKWFHKRGSLGRVETMTKEEVLNSKDWDCGRYTSRVVLLARKRNWN